MERNPIKNDRRAAKREQRQGQDAACARCGMTTPEALRLVNKSWLERHHVAGRAHDAAFTVPLCLNCHRIATEGQLRAGVSLEPQATLPERLLQWLRSVADFLCLLTASVDQFAERLVGIIAGLDRDYPDWRGKEWARA